MARRPSKTTGAPPAHPVTDAWRNFAAAAVERLVVRSWTDDGSSEPVDPQSRDADLEAARTMFHASLEERNPFTVLAVCAELSIVEAEVLAVALGVELDERLQRLLVHVHADAGRPAVEVGDLGDMLGGGGDNGDDDGVDDPRLALGHRAGLRRAGLVAVQAKGPFSRHAVAVHPSVVWALLGDPSPDPQLPPGTSVVRRDEVSDPGTVQIVEGPSGPERHRSLLVLGSDKVRRRQAAIALTEGERFLVAEEPTDDRAWEAVVREATLLGASVILELSGMPDDGGTSWIETATHVPWAITSALPLALERLPRRAWREVECAGTEPSTGEWEAALGTGAPRSHRLSATQLELVANAHAARGGDVDAAVRRLVSGKLDRLARRIRPSRDWNDLVLPNDRMRQLHEVVDRYRHSATVFDVWRLSATPSRGIVALFSGPSGTGKTMAAEVIAGALGLDLFKLELSAVVSKYIGETEKHLDELFDAAGAGNLVLFFDEADALFGKRSEVKDARDRYANIEVSYLLQRIESFDGVVVLATNFEKNIDQAFLRRIHTRVDFVIPSASERETIWRQNFPPSAPVEGIEFEELAARFELSGGSIRNAAVHAAFLAAADGSPITMAHVVRALGREYRKLGRLLKPDDFGEYLDLTMESWEPR